MTNSDFHRSAATEEALPEWEDPRVQTVYELLCAHLVPPGDEHWEGFVARHIVRALSSDGEPSNGKQPLMASRPAPPVPSDAILSLKDEVRGAVARGWCSSDNEHKEMDVDLADSIFAEVWAEVAAHVHTFDVAQAAQEPNEAEIEAWIRILDTEQSRNLVMWRDRALRAERELSEANGKMFAALTAQPPADPVETEEGNYDRSNSEAVAWIAFAGNGNIRLWTADEARAKDEKSRGLDMRAFTLAELVALASKAPTRSSADTEDEAYEIGKRDGYEEAVQELDIFTGGDGEFKGSTLPGGTVDVTSMMARLKSRIGNAMGFADLRASGGIFPETKDMTNIVSRLRNFAIWNNRQSHYEPVPLCKEAADEIEKLHRNLRHWREECGKLHARMPTEPQPSAASVRDALEPFAKLADLFDLYEPKSKTDSVMVNIRLEDLRKARRVLANEPQTLGTTNEGATDV